MLVAARKLLGDPLSPNVEVRYTAIRLSECLADALRVAESRGRRLPCRATPVAATAHDGRGWHGLMPRRPRLTSARGPEL